MFDDKAAAYSVRSLPPYQCCQAHAGMAGWSFTEQQPEGKRYNNFQLTSTGTRMWSLKAVPVEQRMLSFCPVLSVLTVPTQTGARSKYENARREQSEIFPTLRKYQLAYQLKLA